MRHGARRRGRRGTSSCECVTAVTQHEDRSERRTDGTDANGDELHDARTKAARKFEKEVEANLKAVALERARFEVKINAPSDADLQNEAADARLSAKGFDQNNYAFFVTVN